MKRDHGAVAEFKTFFGEQLATVQMEISARLERLQDVAVQRMEELCRKEATENHAMIQVNKQSLLVKPPTTSNVHAAEDPDICTTPVVNFVKQTTPDLPMQLPKSAPHVLELSDMDEPLGGDEHRDRSPLAFSVLPGPPAIPNSVNPPSIPNAVESQENLQRRARFDTGSTEKTSQNARGASPAFADDTCAADDGSPNKLKIDTCDPDLLSEVSKSSRFKRNQKRKSLMQKWDFKPRFTVRDVTPRLNGDSKLLLPHDAHALAEEGNHYLEECVQSAFFADAGAMKEKLREEMLNPKDAKADKYKGEGLAQAVARSEIFEVVTLVVIALNALWMAIDVDLNRSLTLIDAHPVFIVGENLFCLYFVWELGTRFVAFRSKRDCFSDRWFIFDLVLVSLMVTETWIISIGFLIFDVGGTEGAMRRFGNASIFRMFRFMRLTKMARLARLLFALPELMVMVRGVRFAARTVFFCLVLIISVIFVFAICFRELTDGLHVGHQYFETVPEAMTTLLIYGTMPDTEPLIRSLGEVQVLFGVLVVFFICIIAFTLMNMLVGVLVGIMGEIASVEKERMTISSIKSQLDRLFSSREIDIDADGRISAEEFERLLEHPVAIRALTQVGVDVLGLIDVQEFVFSGGDRTLSFSDFVEMVLNLRGSNHATVKDIVDFRMFLGSELNDLEERLVQHIHPIRQTLTRHVGFSEARFTEAFDSGFKTGPCPPR